jgi:hypothetical protein
MSFLGDIIMAGESSIDGLEWWGKQKMAGIDHDGLTDLALDVLCAPGASFFFLDFDTTSVLISLFFLPFTATSVDVERLFSTAGHQLTPRRHRLAAEQLGYTVTLGAYSRAGLIPGGLLEDRCDGHGKEKGEEWR